MAMWAGWRYSSTAAAAVAATSTGLCPNHCRSLACRLPGCLDAEEGSRESVDAKCMKLTAPWVRERAAQDEDIEVRARGRAGAAPHICVVWLALGWVAAITC